MCVVKDIFFNFITTFIPLAIVLSLFIGLAITGAAALSNIFQKLTKPLSSEATQERYKEWKENKVSKKDK